MMEDTRSLAEKVIDGDVDIHDCDLNLDFEDYEVEMLLAAGRVNSGSFSDSRAAELIIAGVLSFADRPFEDFPPCKKIRLLSGGAVTEEEFRRRANLAEFDGADWLELVAESPAFAAEAPWEKMRAEAAPGEWFACLARRPEFADHADWERLCRDGLARDVFRMLENQPQLYDRLLCKEELLAADSRRWVELIIRQPRFADVYPVETLDEIDEIELLLLYRPELARRLPWQPENPPVKLVVVNRSAPYYGHYDEVRALLLDTLHYSRRAAEGRTALVTENRETFAGIFDRVSARRMAAEFREKAKAARLPLAIRLEELDNDD